MLCYIWTKGHRKTEKFSRYENYITVSACKFTKRVIRRLYLNTVNKSIEKKKTFLKDDVSVPGKHVSCFAAIPQGRKVNREQGKRHWSLPEKCGECWTWRTDKEAAALVRESSQNYEAAHTRLCLLSLWRGNVNREGERGAGAGEGGKWMVKYKEQS